MGFSRQEYWKGLPFPSPGELPDPGIEPRSPALQADTLPSEPPGKPIGEISNSIYCFVFILLKIVDPVMMSIPVICISVPLGHHFFTVNS